jgi:hypothetical protein
MLRKFWGRGVATGVDTAGQASSVHLKFNSQPFTPVRPKAPLPPHSESRVLHGLKHQGHLVYH